MKWDEVKQMICTKCGARLQQTDQFCPKCGARVIKDRRCPDCGEVLRDGVKFCPGCGRAVGSSKSTPAVSDETLDIPIDAIEKNILSETAAEIKAERRTGSAPARRNASGDSSQRRSSSGEKTVKRTPARNETAGSTSSRRTASGQGTSAKAPVKKKQAAAPAPPPRKKKPVYREEVWEDDDWDDEEEWDDDDWDDDDWDDDEEGVDAITIMTVVTGCLLLIVVAVLGFHFYRQYVPKNYDKAAEEEQEAEEGEEDQETSGQGGEEGSGEDEETEIASGISKLTIDSDVNVRDQPSTSGTNVLKVAKAGETYDCNGGTEDGEWYEIVLEDGTIGYVFHDYVSVE